MIIDGRLQSPHRLYATLREEAVKAVLWEKIALVEKNRYSVEARKEIDSYEQRAKQAIEAAKTPEEIEAAVTAFSASAAKVAIDTAPLPEQGVERWAVVLIVIGGVMVLLVALAVTLKILARKREQARLEELCREREKQNAPEEIAQEIQPECPEVKQEKASAEPVAEEKSESVSEEKRALFESFAAISPKSFAERLDGIDEATKGFYEQIKAELLSYKKVKERLSQKGESFRVGGELIAKIAITGKTVKCYLALDPADYDVKIYRHADMSARRSCAAVPTLVRVRSKLAAKRAVRLIAELAQKNGLVKK